MRVFDKHGTERSMNWLRLKYGNVRYLDAGNTTKFKLIEVRETTGRAVFRVLVVHDQGGPQYAQPVINHYPDPSLPSLLDGGLKTLYHDYGLVLRTGADGLCDFGFGKGSMIRDLGAGGPHTFWIGSPTLPSDGLAGVGWLGGTDHDGPNLMVFQIVAAEEGGWLKRLLRRFLQWLLKLLR